MMSDKEYRDFRFGQRVEAIGQAFTACFGFFFGFFFLLQIATLYAWMIPAMSWLVGFIVYLFCAHTVRCRDWWREPVKDTWLNGLIDNAIWFCVADKTSSLFARMCHWLTTHWLPMLL